MRSSRSRCCARTTCSAGCWLTGRSPGEFAPEIVELLKTFATQSALAIQNARLFREIAEKGRQLEAASRHKSDFLASMSHELRTPLNAILGFNEMILGQIYGEVPASMKEPLEDIQTSGKHLLRLINNVLDLAKIEAGRMELALSDYSVQDTVESVRATLRPLAADKGLEFVATVPSDLPLAYGDSGRITQCLMNLAGNSLKFTKAGKVEISVEAMGDLLVYKVADTGIGIPPDKLETVFAEFKQTDATIASEYGGTGLGLSISRKFIEMHGGRIWVESETRQGLDLHFRDSAARERWNAGMSAKTILYVEDNEMNRKIVRDLLKRTTYQLIEAHDGEAGVTEALEKRPDLILMDIQLPKISGIEAMRRLRAEDATANTPIIAITSFALSGDEQKAKEAGATAYLAKPYSPFDLLKLIGKLLPDG